MQNPFHIEMNKYDQKYIKYQKSVHCSFVSTVYPLNNDGEAWNEQQILWVFGKSIWPSNTEDERSIGLPEKVMIQQMVFVSIAKIINKMREKGGVFNFLVL